MTTLKEKIVAAARNSKILKKIKVCIAIANFLIIVMCFFKVTEVLIIPLIPIVVIIDLVCIFSWAVIDAINSEDEEVIQKNKLIYILLSNMWVVWTIIWSIMYAVIVLFTSEDGVFIQVVVTIVLFIISEKITKVINKCFKNKLSR